MLFECTYRGLNNILVREIYSLSKQGECWWCEEEFVRIGSHQFLKGTTLRERTDVKPRRLGFCCLFTWGLCWRLLEVPSFFLCEVRPFGIFFCDRVRCPYLFCQQGKGRVRLTPLTLPGLSLERVLHHTNTSLATSYVHGLLHSGPRDHQLLAFSSFPYPSLLRQFIQEKPINKEGKPWYHHVCHNNQ